MSIEVVFLSLIGSWFHTFGPDIEKALKPTVVREKRVTSRSKESAERSVLCGTYGLMMSFKYDGISLLYRHWWQSSATLYSILAFTGSQWSLRSRTVTESCFDLRMTSLAALFWIRCNLLTFSSGIPSTYHYKLGVYRYAFCRCCRYRYFRYFFADMSIWLFVRTNPINCLTLVQA